MNRHWLITIIRMLNAVDEQLSEFNHYSAFGRYQMVRNHLRAAISELNSLFDELQQVTN